MLRWLKVLWKPILEQAIELVAPFLLTNAKLQEARRYALIAQAMAAAVLMQFPAATPAQVMAEVLEMILRKWPSLPLEAARRIAAAAALQAAAPAGASSNPAAGGTFGVHVPDSPASSSPAPAGGNPRARGAKPQGETMRNALILAFGLALACAAPARAIDFSLSMNDASEPVQCVPDGGCSVPIYAYATAGNIRFLKFVVEYDASAFTLEGFTPVWTGGYLDENTDLPFGVCGNGVTENALYMLSGGDWGTGGLVGYVNFTALDEWTTHSAPVRFDCFCGVGVSHLEMLTYDTAPPYGVLDGAFNRCDESFTVLDGSIEIVQSKPVATSTGTWAMVKRLYK